MMQFSLTSSDANSRDVYVNVYLIFIHPFMVFHLVLITRTENLLAICLFVLQVASQACSYPCRCPSQPLQCPAGTSLLLDGCGCCKVCARQLGDLCSLQKPCDHHKGLYCDFSKIHRDSGVCLGELLLP